jgi:hypothetical protein
VGEERRTGGKHGDVFTFHPEEDEETGKDEKEKGGGRITSRELSKVL